VYYFKEIYGSKYIVNGKAVDFEQLEGDQGVLMLEVGRDNELIHALNDAANRHIGGIVRINEAQYAEKKTQFGSVTSERRLPPGQEMLRVMQPVTPFGPRDPVPAAAAKPHVPNPPTPFAPTPRTATPPPATQPALTPEEVAAQTGEVQLPMKDPKEFKPATRKLSHKPEEVTP
jgi:hypothetical protein